MDGGVWSCQFVGVPAPGLESEHAIESGPPRVRIRGRRIYLHAVACAQEDEIVEELAGLARRRDPRIRDAPTEGFPDVERTRSVVCPNEDEVQRLGFASVGTCTTRRHPIRTGRAEICI